MDGELKKLIDELEKEMQGMDIALLEYKRSKKKLGKRAIDPDVERILKEYTQEAKLLRELIRLIHKIYSEGVHDHA